MTTAGHHVIQMPNALQFLTFEKLKTTTSMKIEIGKTLKSRTVYEITFQRCTSCYVDKNPPSSTRSSDTIVRAVHLTVLVRFKKNARPSMPVEKRHRLCDLGCVMPQQNLKIKTLVSTNEFLVSSLTRNSLTRPMATYYS